MTAASVTDELPELYGAWVTMLVGRAVPHEPLATCHDCAMCAPDVTVEQLASSRRTVFEPHLKCCTFFPVLPNFLVGHILSTTDERQAPGRRLLAERIERGVAVSPLGVSPPAGYELWYRNADGAFGRSESLACPYLVQRDGGGSCAIWAHRNSVCATFFCKHQRGAVGGRFWRQLKTLLSTLESAVSRHCVLELDVGPSALAALHNESKQQRLGPGDLARRQALDPQLWGRWSGRETQFFAACGRLAGQLEKADLLAIGGSELRTHLTLAAAAFAELGNTVLPERLRVGSYQVIDSNQERALLATYSEYDPIEVPAAVLRALPAFDGRTHAEVRAAIAREVGIDADDNLIRTLVDFAILVPVEPVE